MRSKSIRFALASAVGTLVLLAGGVAALAVDYWSGQDQPPPPGGNNNFSNGDNWVDGTAPGTNEDVVIDDTTPRPTVKITGQNRRINSVFVGDGHTIKLTYALNVTKGAQFEGTVKLKGDGYVGPEFVVVNSRDQDTVIEYDGTGDNDYYMLST